MGKPIENPWISLLHELGPQLAANAAECDRTDAFVSKNYELLKARGILRAMIPVELGGGGATYAEMCHLLRELARYCASTALALSMHQHLVAANVWKYRRGKGGEDVLQKVVANDLVLVSTGAGDWLDSSGTMERVEGGFRFSGIKHFASQSAAGDVLVTSAPYEDPEAGWQVLHFAVLFANPGVRVLDNWQTLGMRGTGSHSVKITDVFVPDAAIVLRRPRGEYHPVWNIVLGVAMPLIMAVYVGIAERAADLAVEQLKARQPRQPQWPYLVGEMHNERTAARALLDDMIRLNDNFQFPAEDEIGHAMLTRKTLIANAAEHTVRKAMEAVGGQSFFRNHELERLFRDVQAGGFHPLPEKTQQAFTGAYLLNH